MNLLKNFLPKILSFFKQSFAGEWYYGHNERDKKILYYVFVAVALLLIWFLCIKPITDWNFDQKSSAVAAYRVFSTIESNSTQLRQNSSKNGIVTSKQESLIPVITKTASLRNIQLNRLEPDSDDAVTIFVEKQSFNSIIKWIAQLEENNQISVGRLNIESDESTKRITAQITFIK